MHPRKPAPLRRKISAALLFPLLAVPAAEARLAEIVNPAGLEKDPQAATMEAFNQVIDLATRDLLSDYSADEPGEDADGPILGMPKVDRMLLDRRHVWMNPTYWETYAREVVLRGNIQNPSPTDIVKPEAWTANVHVANDPQYVSPLQADTSAIADFGDRTYDWGGETKTVKDFMITTETDVVLFLVDGVIVGELYNNGYNPEVRHQPWSVTKTFIAALVGHAVAEGLVDLKAPIETYIPELAGPPPMSLTPIVYSQNPAAWPGEMQPQNRAHTDWKGVSVEDVLQMESGVHWDEDMPVLALNTQVQQWIMVLLDHYSNGQLGMTRNEFLMSLPDSHRLDRESADYDQTQPDQIFSYNSGNTQVLAWMLEYVYGTQNEDGTITPKPFNEIVSERLWKPMGAYRDAKMIADREGSVIASQGLYARPYDFARFGEVMRNVGKFNGVQVLPEGWIAQMTDVGPVNPVTGGANNSSGRYAYQTWSSTAGNNAYKATGFQGQKITIVPEQCVTAVRMSHSFGADYYDEESGEYGFGTNFSSDEWAAMVKQLASQFGATCADQRHAQPEEPVQPRPGRANPPRSPRADEKARN